VTAESAAARISLDAFPPAARRALQLLDAVLGATPGWLVGGVLRHALLGEAVEDVDVAVKSGALSLGRAMANALPGAGFFVLDERRGVCRVVSEVQVDIADLRAADLAADLALRDFTVNALASPIHELVRDGSATVLDPTGGVDDLSARVIRPCGPGVIADDPLRVLRAVRLAMRPGWRLHAAAETAIREAAALTSSVSAERVRDEMRAILGEPSAASGLRMLDRLGVLPVLLPESLAMKQTTQPEPHIFDVWEHSLRAVDAADVLLTRLRALEPFGPELEAHLDEPLGDGFTRREALKLAALLHDVAKPETKTVEDGRIRFFGHDVVGAERAALIGQRWRLSNRATGVVQTLVRHHLRPMHLGNAGGVTRRASFRFFRDLGTEARDLVLLSLTDAAGVRGDSPLAVWTGPGGMILKQLMQGVGEEHRAATVPPLLRGEDVMTAFGLAPGPEVGALLARAREAQDLGLVSTRAEALDYLRHNEGRALDSPQTGP